MRKSEVEEEVGGGGGERMIGEGIKRKTEKVKERLRKLVG